jgi:hypothetical protein
MMSAYIHRHAFAFRTLAERLEDEANDRPTPFQYCPICKFVPTTFLGEGSQKAVQISRNAGAEMTARVIQVIETDNELRGEGTRSSPLRRITQYWTLDGTLLAEHDPLPPALPPDQKPPTATESVIKPAETP